MVLLPEPLLSAFTSYWGTMLHPLSMLIIVPAWILTLVLGVKARNKRLHAPPVRNAENSGLLSGIIRDKKGHHKLASGTFFFTVVALLTGMANTYCRKGRLFPGPHLYGGLAIILVASCNVALVPWFADYPLARLPHMTMGIFLIILLALQVYSGLDIVSEV